MSMQTMNLHSVVSATVTKCAPLLTADGNVCYTQEYVFTNADGHTFTLTTFSDSPGVLKLASE